MADDAESGSAPQTTLQSTMNSWAHLATLVLGLIGTAIGIWATYQSNVANDRAKVNSDRLQALQVQLQAANTFANGIHEARDALAQTNAAGGIPAMVEVSRLYEVATTPQQKLVLIQIAQLSKQQAAMFALSTLVANDPDLQSPAEGDRATVIAIGRILRNATTEIAQSATAPPTVKPAPAATAKHGATPAPRRPATPVPTPHPPSDDPALTASSNHLVAANAALVASLPKTEGEQGWVFAGDVKGWDGSSDRAGAALIPYTSSLSSSVVPSPSQSVLACADVNIRAVPLANGALGAVVGIVPQGTVLHVERPTAGSTPVRSAIKTVSKVNGAKITARWIYVAVAASLAKGAASAAPATSAPSLGSCSAAAPAAAQ